MRIAILLTSNDKSDFANRFPNDGKKFIALLKPVRPDWVYEVFPVFEDEFPGSVTAFDGYIITGSPTSVRDQMPWVATLLRFIRDMDAERVKLIGACFGHQAIALALGGEVGNNPQGWEVGTSKTKFQRLPWMDPHRPSLTLHAAHKEQVISLPDQAELIGKTPGCPLSAFKIGDHIMTTEFHPEMPAEFMIELVDEMGDQLTDEQVQLARQEIARGEDGAIFARWMCNFLES